MNPQDSLSAVGTIKGDKLYIDDGMSISYGINNFAHAINEALAKIEPSVIPLFSIFLGTLTIILVIIKIFFPGKLNNTIFPLNLITSINNSFKILSNIFLDMSDVGKRPAIETSKMDFDQYLLKEYQSASTTRKVFTNIFVICSLAMISWVIFFSKDSSIESKISIGTGYLGMASFMIFIIRSCYSRTSVILAINEDFNKQKQISNYIRFYKKNSDMNEHDVEIIKEMCQSRAEREKQPKPPTDIVLKNISDSSLNIIGKKGIVKGHKGSI